MKLIIAGGRDIYECGFVEATINMLDIADDIEEIVWGCATGVDASGKKWADEHGVPAIPFEANWYANGYYEASQGPIRNEKMAKYGTHLLLVWDGVSKGSSSMRRLFLKYHTENELFEVIIKGRKKNA